MTRLFSFLLFLAIATGSIDAIASSPAAEGKTRILVAYFSQPEDVELKGVDGVSGASLLQKNNTKMGSTQYIAQLIQQQTTADIFRIETVKPYPVQHDALLKYAEKEQKDGVRPPLKEKINNLDDYDIVFIGYPIWWYKMPMAMYSFFEQQSFNGKTIIPFTTHGGSRFSDSLREIKRIQPDARLITKGLAISRDDVVDKDIPQQIANWLQTLPALK
ncbi:flavodoxin [Klebsiella oxytoca]|uniref:flavodoxin n=1 Tax=Klebsiella oxytoca TaxID=571 RepID=UPI00190EFFDE|nr:flavodoxin [Klebsiella oxytoca]MBK0678719.1 flavodoxin [Klebsiella oxytoca]